MKNKDVIDIAVIGVGNCASSLVQLLAMSRQQPSLDGLLHGKIAGYMVDNVRVVAAIDIDRRKVGKDLADAIFQEPNCTTKYVEVPQDGVIVSLGRLEDGVSEELHDKVHVHPDALGTDRSILVDLLRSSGAQIVVNFLPVGSQRDSFFYADLACEAGCAFVNCNPELIATAPEMVQRFEEAELPILGDDIKSQIGATMLHRAIADKLLERGASIERTYQLNVGGNTDFLNMTSRNRAATKKHTKTASMRAVIGDKAALNVGPSDYVPLLGDRKVAYIRVEGASCLGMQFSFEGRLEVEDSPNAAGVAIDAILCARVALDRSLKGAIPEPCGYLFKHPPVSYDEQIGRTVIDKWIDD